MGRVVYQEIVNHAARHLACTSLTADEFAILLPSFETALQAHMERWCLDGSPRTARRSTTYKNCPLPTPSERLLFITMYVKTNPLQDVHGALFGMPQGKANMWIDALLPVLHATFRTLGDAPTRNLADLATRLGTPPAAICDAAEHAPPFFVTMAPSDGSSVPRMRMNRRAVSAARKNVIRLRTCCSSMQPCEFSFCVTRMKAAPTINGSLMPHRIPCLEGVGCSKTSAL